ncbi:MAG: DUF4412 domain-containing protein [Bacteroidia bacterium]|nr:DUF4412 domain-containing protein [Bacteroidia bacterium]
MKNLSHKLIIVLLAVAGFASVSFAQFEGTIEFKKKSATDTTKYIYYVKGNKIRIDEIGSQSKKIEGTFLIDLAAGTMMSLSHDRKLYMDQKPGAPVAVGGKPEIKNTKTSKSLQGINCKEIIVSNVEEKTTIKYYIGGSKYDFFVKMLRLLNRKDKQSSYFLLLGKEAGDGFPYLSIQTDETGKEVGRLEVDKIEKKAIDTEMFDIPKDYHKFEKN